MSISGRRIFFDVTYTCTQVGPVGITRTVEKLVRAVTGIVVPQGGEVCCVRLGSGGRWRVHDETDLAAGVHPPAGGPQRRRWLDSPRLRRAAMDLMPPRLLELAWRTHNALALRAPDHRPEVAWRAGDWLVLADEGWNYDSVAAAERARRAGAAVVWVVYDLIPVMYPQFCAPLFTRVFSAWLERMVRVSDAAICISRATQGDLVEYCAQRQWQCPPAGSFRLGSDLLPAAGEGCRDGLREFLEADAPCFACVGSLEPRKNHRGMLDAFEAAWARGESWRLVIAGRVNPMCADLARALAAHPEAGRRLLVLHDASDSEIDQLYARARALIMPTLAEGFGLPVVEARVRGCPVIASDIAAIREIADAGVDLYPADSVSALSALLAAHAQTTDRRESVGAAVMFSWRQSATQLLDTGAYLLERT